MSQDLAGGRHQAGERDASDAAHIGSASAALRTFRCPADDGGSGEESKVAGPDAREITTPGFVAPMWAVAATRRHHRCIGAVIRDHRGMPVGGISMSAMAFEIDQKRVQKNAPLVIAAAREISQALGYRPTISHRPPYQVIPHWRQHGTTRTRPLTQSEHWLLVASAACAPGGELDRTLTAFRKDCAKRP
jgi:Bacterial transcriptional regulator